MTTTRVMPRYDNFEKMVSRLLDTGVGFDRLTRPFGALTQFEATTSFPPYNIEKLSDDTYQISLAVAGFKEEDISITEHDGKLIIENVITEDANDDKRVFLYKGIAERNFRREFILADFVVVQQASLDNGILNIVLKQNIPEEKKPKKIQIGGFVE